MARNKSQSYQESLGIIKKLIENETDMRVKIALIQAATALNKQIARKSNINEFDEEICWFCGKPVLQDHFCQFCGAQIQNE